MARLAHLVFPLIASSLATSVLLGGTAVAAAPPGVARPGSVSGSVSGPASGSTSGLGGAARTAVLADRPAWATTAADRGPVADSDVLTARVGLAGRDPAGLEAYARAVSTPGSPLYRRFLTPDQARARFGPSAAQTADVRSWLSGAGLTVRGTNQHWIDVSGPASALRRAFGVRIDRYGVPGARLRRAPAGPATVPARLAGAVSGISGLTEVARGMREGATGAALAETALRAGPAQRAWHPGAVREGATGRHHPIERARLARPGVAPGASGAEGTEGTEGAEGADGATDTQPGTETGGAPGTSGAEGAKGTKGTDGATGAGSAGSAKSIEPGPETTIEPGTVMTHTAIPVPSAPITADSSQACSADWGATPAVGFPAGYTPSAPLDVCGYVPSQLRKAYGVTASGLTGKGVTVGVVDAYASPTMLNDADTFAARHGDRAFASGQYQEYVTRSQWTHTTDGVCQDPSDWSGEEALDIEMAHALAPDATVRYFGADSCTDADLAAAMAKIVDSRLADVVSGSFGETMHQTSGDIESAIVAQENQVFQTGAAEGIGFTMSSGDCGDDAAGLTGPNCDPQSARAQTEWPASSPWVTAVGGTALAVSHPGAYQWETNMGDRRSVLTADGRSWNPFPGFFYFGGGGGTSEDFAQPSYQAGVVPDAMARTLPTGKRAARPMRTVPDVAMNGDLLTAVYVGQTDPTTGQYSEAEVGGTSASTPMFAGVLADAMQGAHRKFGFANPMLYGRARTGQFTDVVDHPAAAPNPVSTVLDLGVGDDGSRKVRLYELGQDHGLSAGSGYDEATGLGSPRLAFLKSFGG